MIKQNLTPVKAREETRVKKKSFLDNIKDRFHYDIKKMEVLAGKYNTNNKIILNQNALMKAVIYCAVTKKTQGNKEIMGWLVGKRNKKDIEIVDSYVGNCNSSHSYTELDPLDTIKLRNLAKSRGLVLIGQWHFHPSFSTDPSSVDDDFMKNIEKMGIKTPVQLICNMTDFNLSIMENGKRRKADFIIPPKTDNELNINLGYINGEYSFTENSPFYGYASNYEPIEMMEFVSFFGYVGNMLLSMIHIILPFLRLNRWVDWK